MNHNPIMKIENLSIHYPQRDVLVGTINFALSQGKVFGLAGESGSGKSSVCKAILGLLPAGSAKVTGKIEFMGSDILSLPHAERCRINGKDIVLIMQNPMTSFDPCMKIKNHFTMTLMSHLLCSKKDALHYGNEMLKKAGLDNTDKIMNSYPHMLSGGMLQRVMIAIAVSLNPALIIADEPTTALDAASQAEILKLLRHIMQEYMPAMLFISHDMQVLSVISDELAIMKAGRIVETGCTAAVFKSPKHAYTRELISASLYTGGE